MKLETLGGFRRHGFDDVIDVRSPAEYAEDHVPGAISLPVLSDAERAEVGTIYTRIDRFQARKIGAAHVARNAARHLETALADRPGGWRPLVYCWRGGQRSGSFASILAQIGWRVDVLEGGYRSFRHAVHDMLYEDALPFRPVLLDGYTGTAKTAFLRDLAAAGHQVLDLEALARHRGSALGLEAPQPGQKAFESAVAWELAAFDPGRPVLIEAESRRIGALQLPPMLWQAMRAAPRVRIDAPVAARAHHLLEAYADLLTDRAEFAARLEPLKPFHGAERIAEWRALLATGADLDLATALIEAHYDPRYDRSVARSGSPVATVGVDSLDARGRAAALDRLAAALERAALNAGPAARPRP